MPGIGIITNPHSKANKRDPSKPALLGYILGQRGQLAVTNSLDHLQQVAENFRDSSIEILAINGGDGTVSQTITAFKRAYGSTKLPKIALLRGGTMNVLATNLGIFGTPEKLLYQLVEGYSTGRLNRVVNLPCIDVEGHIGFLYADGISCRVLEEFYSNKTGPLGAALMVGKLVLSALTGGAMAKRILRTSNVVIEADGASNQELVTVGTFASTIERMPFGFRLFPFVRGNSSRFQFVAVKTPPDRLVFEMPNILFKHELGDGPSKLSFCTGSMQIRSDDSVYSLDGEIYHATSDCRAISLGEEIQFLLTR